MNMIMCMIVKNPVFKHRLITIKTVFKDRIIYCLTYRILLFSFHQQFHNLTSRFGY